MGKASTGCDATRRDHPTGLGLLPAVQAPPSAPAWLPRAPPAPAPPHHPGPPLFSPPFLRFPVHTHRHRCRSLSRQKSRRVERATHLTARHLLSAKGCVPCGPGCWYQANTFSTIMPVSSCRSPEARRQLISSAGKTPKTPRLLCWGRVGRPGRHENEGLGIGWCPGQHDGWGCHAET